MKFLGRLVRSVRSVQAWVMRLLNPNPNPNPTLALALTVTAAILMTDQAHAQSLELLLYHPMPEGGEVVAFDPALRRLAVTTTDTVSLLTLTEEGFLEHPITVDIQSAFAGELTGLDIDPAGRGVGVACVVPSESRMQTGVVVAFDLRSGAVVGQWPTGFHPDAVRFSEDGAWLLIADEGQFTVGGDDDAPGSLTVIRCHDAAGLAAPVDQWQFEATYTFEDEHLAADVDLDRLRLNDPTTTQPYRHAEPEYLTTSGQSVFVTLQENNAIAVFDLETRQWTAIWPLGVVRQSIDAMDGDERASFNARVDCLPCPDMIAHVQIRNRLYLLTANEGDFRLDNADRARGETFRSLAPAATESPLELEWELGRLRLSLVDSDPDGDGRLDRVVAMGARSFSIWDGQTGQLVADSGSLEPFLFEQDPLRHNQNAADGDATATIDSRSDDKGPEPEGIAVTTVDGRSFVAVGMERQNGIVLAEITDPTEPRLLAVTNAMGKHLVAPETLRFIDADDSPWGIPTLIVGYEGNGLTEPETAYGSGVAFYGLRLNDSPR